MINDITKEIKAQLYDRVRSPLFGAFAIAWIFYNYRPLLAIFSNMTFPEKIAYLDSFYAILSYSICHVFLWPLLSALTYLLIYPYPAKLAYEYWAKRQMELKEIQQKIEDEMPMTHADAKALRDSAIDMQRSLREKIQEISFSNSELEKQIKITLADLATVSQERNKLKDEINFLNNQINEHRAAIIKPLEPLTLDNIISKPSIILKQKLTENILNQLLSRLGNEDIAVDVMLALVKTGGIATVNSLAGVLAFNAIDIRTGLDRIKGLGFVEELSEQDSYRLTLEGRRFVSDLKLTTFIG